MKVLLSVLLCLGLALAVRDLEEERNLFLEFQHTYGKTYSSEEFHQRFLTFRSNLKKADELSAKGQATFGVTKFMDLSTEEFKQMYLMPNYVQPTVDESLVAPKLEEVDAPTEFDWRSKNAITPVKNQEQCGSCWAFSATETIESYWFLAGHSLPTLAPQQIVDCDQTSYGCNGGWTYSAFQYVISAGGLDTESSYPYTAQDGYCSFKKNDVGAKISSYNYITRDDDENQMLQWAASKGPLSVCVDASSWQTYTGGVIQAGQCGQQVDHCVMVTGYSTQNGIKSWNVRNSWGADWGVGGYLYVQRGDNVCAIASTVTAVTAA